MAKEKKKAEPLTEAQIHEAQKYVNLLTAVRELYRYDLEYQQAHPEKSAFKTTVKASTVATIANRLGVDIDVLWSIYQLQGLGCTLEEAERLVPLIPFLEYGWREREEQNPHLEINRAGKFKEIVSGWRLEERRKRNWRKKAELHYEKTIAAFSDPDNWADHYPDFFDKRDNTKED